MNRIAMLLSRTKRRTWVLYPRRKNILLMDSALLMTRTLGLATAVTVKVTCVITFEEKPPSGTLIKPRSLVNLTTLLKPVLTNLPAQLSRVLPRQTPLWVASLGLKLVLSLTSGVTPLRIPMSFLSGLRMLVTTPSTADPLELPALIRFIILL